MTTYSQVEPPIVICEYNGKIYVMRGCVMTVVEPPPKPPRKPGSHPGRSKGWYARAASMSPEQRKEQARLAARARWRPGSADDELPL